jgi:LytS/YehU family sensor histidine kinase
VLAAQVEPHFLFNTLAGVRSAISTDPPRASEMIDRLVDYLRAAIPRLRSDGGAQATLGSQLDIVRAYLGLMAARMPRLSYAIDVPAELLAEPARP